MLKSFKHFLWGNKYTKRLYRTLWHLKHEGITSAWEYYWNGEKKKSKKKKKIKTFHYEMIHSMWRVYGAVDNVISQLEFYSQSDWCWKNENRRLWLIYISCLIERGEKESAKVILRQYISMFQLKDIERFLPIASYAKEIGIRSDEIEMANRVLNVLEDNLRSHLFENLVKGKRIAVVGNAGCELGLGRGYEIDSHDIVIRFNNFPCEYIDDYGEKTDIWVRAANISVKDRDISSFELVIWEPDYWHMEVQYDHLDILYKEVLDYPQKVIFIDCAVKRALYDKSKIYCPTTGCFLLWMLYQALGTLENVDIYGFSFPYEENLYDGHYYDDLSLMTTVHNMNLERAFLRELLRKENSELTYVPQIPQDKTNEE